MRFKNANGETETHAEHRFNATAKEIASIQGEEPADLCKRAMHVYARKMSVASCLIGLYNYDLHVTGLGETPFDGSRDLWIAARVKFVDSNVAAYIGYRNGKLGGLGVH